MIAGLLLAAGASRRFGSNKLLATLAGRPVIRWSADALAPEVDVTYVVVPSDAAPLRDALAGLAVHWVENPAAHEGMASSIRYGVGALPDGAEAVVVTLADQPTLDPRLVARVVARWRTSAAPPQAVTTAYDDGQGHPSLFAAPLFPALLEALGDALDVVTAPGVRPPDVDTPEVLEALETGLRTHDSRARS